MISIGEIALEAVKVLLACAFVFATWFAIEVIKLKRFHGILKRMGIPGPEPSIEKNGNMVDFYEHYPKRDIIAEWAIQNNGMAGFYYNNQIYIVTDDLDILKTVFIDKPTIFSEREDQVIGHAFAENVFFLKPNRWRQNRRIFTSLFTSYGSKSPEVTQVIENSANELIDCIKERSEFVDGKRVTKITDCMTLMESYSMTALARLAVPELGHYKVGQEITDSSDLDNYSVGYSFAEIVYKYPFMKPIIDRLSYFLAKFSKPMKIDKMVSDFCDKTADYIRMRLKMGENYKGGKTPEEKQLDESYESDANKSYVGSLVYTFVKEYVAGNITYSELRGNMFVSTPIEPEATSRFLNNLMYSLGKYPDVQEKLRNAVKEHGPEAPYVRQFILEVQRLYSPVGNAIRRKSNQEYTMKGITFPKGTVFLYQSNVLSKSPKIWKNPEEFDPERFAKGTELHPCALKPFGFGAKQCPAFRYIMNEAKVTVAAIVSRYKVVTKSPEVFKQELWQLDLNTCSDKVHVEFEEL